MPHQTRYFVTIATMTPETGANSFGHTFVTFAKEAEGGRVEVTDAYGYYSEPPSAPSSKIFKMFKDLVGLDINFTGGYGHFQREEVRYMHNAPLPSVTFLISKEAYLQVKKELGQQIALENRAVAEITERLRKKDVATVKYKGKDKFLSDDILSEEKLLAKAENREPRLSLFEIRLDIDYSGRLAMPTLSRSHNCRIGAMELLALSSVPESALESLGKGTSLGTIPLIPVIKQFYYKGAVQQVLFYSQGDETTHLSPRTGITHYSRSWEKDKLPFSSASSSLFKEKKRVLPVRVFFSIPPQNIQKSDSVTEKEVRIVRRDYDIDRLVLKKILPVITKVQQLELLILNNEVPATAFLQKSKLLSILRDYYQLSFSRYKKTKAPAYMNMLIEKGKKLLNSIQDGFNPYESSLTFSSDDDTLHLPLSSLSNEKLCSFFKVGIDSDDDSLPLHL